MKSFYSLLVVVFCFMFWSSAWGANTDKVYQDAESAAMVLVRNPIAYYDCDFSFVRPGVYEYGETAINGNMRINTSGEVEFFSVEGVVLLDVDSGDEPLPSIPADSGDGVKWYNLTVYAKNESNQTIASGYFYKSILVPGDAISVEMKFTHSPRKIAFIPPEDVADHEFLLRYEDADYGKYTVVYDWTSKTFPVYVDPSMETFYEIYDSTTGEIYGNGYLYPEGRNDDGSEVSGHTINFQMPGGVIVVPSDEEWIRYGRVVADSQTFHDGIYEYCKTFLVDARAHEVHVHLYNNTTTVLSAYRVNDDSGLSLFESVSCDDFYSEQDQDNDCRGGIRLTVPMGDYVVVSVIASTPDQTFDIYFQK